MAMQGAQFALREEAEPTPPKKKKLKGTVRVEVNDTAIQVSAESMLALQKAAEMDEVQLIQVFIEAIESEYE